MIPKRYDKFGTVKILTVSRKQWYKNVENPSKFVFIVHPLIIFKSLVSRPLIDESNPARVLVGRYLRTSGYDVHKHMFRIEIRPNDQRLNI